MLSRLRFTLLLPLVALLACGSTAPVSAANPTPSGDYAFTISPVGVTGLNFSGSLNVSGSSFSGVFRYNNPSASCVAATQDISFSGAVVNNVLTLTSGSFSGSVATLTIPIPLITTNTGTQIANGTAVISGGTCAVASSPIKLTYIPPFGQAWTGSLTGPVDGTVSMSITESPANADGQFPVVSTVAFSSTACSFSYTGVTGLVSGYNLSLSNSQIVIGANATTSPVTFNMNLPSPNTTTCPAGAYAGTIH